DWGANVLKVELPASVEGNAALGGPRHGSDFQNLHRNKRSITLNLKEPESLAYMQTAGGHSGRGGGELPPGRQIPPGGRLRVAQSGQSPTGVRQYLWLWRGRSLSGAPGLRPDCPGDGRPDVDYGHPGAGSGAGWHSYCRLM